MTPLIKRLPRDFIHNLGKHLGLFFLISLATAFTSGFLGAAASIKDVCDGMRDAYNIEDFYFTTMYKMEDDDIFAIESRGARVYENFSRDVPLELENDEREMSVRVFRQRGTEFNQAIYNEGVAPARDNEVALDRVFCSNHNLVPGDKVRIAGEEFTLSGICVLSDYSVTYKQAGDFMFNAVTFTVAQLCDEAYESIAKDAETFTYSVLLNNRSLPLHERISFEEDLVDLLVDRDVTVTNLVDADANIGLTFASSDVEADSSMWEVLMFILIAIMAFVFVVLTDATIEQESAVIGTLLASGYRKGELIHHYLITPALIGLAGIAIGNAFGSTLLVQPMRNLYYNSYSLPPFVYHWHWPVFFLTSVAPLAVLLLITLLGLMRKLSATPLQFLRHEASRKARRGGLPLSERLPYALRFRLRVFFRNASHFATLFLGIMFGSILLMLGLCMLPLVDYNAKLMEGDVPAEHLYTLKTQLVLDGTQEERDAWAAAEELTTNPVYDALDLDLLEDLGDQLKDLGLDFDSFAGGGEGSGEFNLPPEIEEAVEASVDEDTDFTDPALLFAVRAFAEAAGIDLTGATDAELTHLLETADTFHKQLHSLGDEHMERAAEYLEDIMAIDELPEDPVNQTQLSQAQLDQAELFCVASLTLPRRLNKLDEEISVYGIPENSRYWEDIDVSDGAIVVGEGVLQKCSIELGESAILTDRFRNKSYEIVPTASGARGTTMSIYMSVDTFNELFDNDKAYWNGIASDMELPLDGRYVSSELTPDKMTSMSDQMQDSMGFLMQMMVGMVVPIYLVLIYLLTKTVIDRSARSISYMKVFGYKNIEIDSLYVRAITITVIASLVVCLPLIDYIVKLLVPLMLSRYSGNFVMNIEPALYARIVVVGLITYFVVAALHLARIRRIPLSLAMKVQE